MRPIQSLLWLPVLLCAGALTAGTASAAAVTLNPVGDVTILEDQAARSGAIGDIYVGRTNNAGVRRGLIAFDIAAAIPPGSTITSVRLELTVKGASGGSQPTDNYGVHRVLAAWGEGTSVITGGSGATATTGDATWTERFFNQAAAWASAGGDFDATASATADAPATAGAFAFDSTAPLVADVQGWLDSPSTAFGWLLIGNEARPSSNRVIASREDADDAPRLVVEFVSSQPVPGTTPLGLGILALVLGLGIGLLLRYRG